jgi:DNA-directed RNA polymerase subunit M/transcription elongation factor TFIIS
MQAWLIMTQFSVLAICFTLDPTPTVAEDITDKTTERYLFLNYAASTDNNINDKNDQKKHYDVIHSCHKCNSHSLTFESISTLEGKQIQLINCKACYYEWQETWILPNWFWIKTSLPDNHWTSERWNLE